MPAYGYGPSVVIVTSMSRSAADRRRTSLKMSLDVETVATPLACSRRSRNPARIALKKGGASFGASRLQVAAQNIETCSSGCSEIK